MSTIPVVGDRVRYYPLSTNPLPSFRFALNDTAMVTVSGETGVVVGRAEHWKAEPQYLLRYRRNDGVATEQWWCDSALT